MNIFLCGQKAFGSATLSLLLRLGHQIAGVSAPPETYGGRADQLWFDATKRGLPLQRAGELRASTLPEGVDLILCAHSHDFVGRRTRLAASLGAIGYHPSLLPLHRGRDAVKWAVRQNERLTGGSVYWLDDVVDGGPIASQDWCFVRADDTARSLWCRELFPLGLRLFEQTLGDIERGILVRIPQEDALATWEPSFNPPPLMRPDLPMLSDGRQSDFQLVTTRRG